MRISAVALRALTFMVVLAALALTSEANAAGFARSRFFADFTSPYVHHAQITVTYFFHRKTGVMCRSEGETVRGPNRCVEMTQRQARRVRERFAANCRAQGCTPDREICNCLRRPGQGPRK